LFLSLDLFYLSGMMYVWFVGNVAKWLAGKTRPQNDLLCIEWDVKLYLLTEIWSSCIFQVLRF